MSSELDCGCGKSECGCCGETKSSASVANTNRPGLDSLAYRIGTHSGFLDAMKRDLASHQLAVPGEEISRPLGALRVRGESDPAIAFLDAWATVGDVLTFYQERIANEGYLRTASEMRSVHGLAGLVGYRPRPGVASNAFLAYDVDSNTREEVLIPKGSRSQSVPGPGELPQFFETDEDLRARAAWNRLGLRQTQPQQGNDIKNRNFIYLAGTFSRLQPNDPLLLKYGSADPELFRVMAVEADAKADRTMVRFQPWQYKETGGSKHTREFLLRLRDLAKRAPDVEAAKKVIALLERVMGVVEKNREKVVETIYSVRKEIWTLSSTSKGDLLAWLINVDVALKLYPPNPALAAKEGFREELDPAPFSDQMEVLAKPASRPLPNALRLSQSLATGFVATGDAALKLLGAIAPSIKPSLAAAVAGLDRSSPDQRIEAFTFRVKAGPFGRNFPKRMKTVQEKGGETRNEPIGEWPIVESEKVLYLDAHYDGIVPGSWIVIDSQAANSESGDIFMIRPAKPLLITKVELVQSKITRAEYGGSGDSVELRLNDDWLTIREIEIELKDQSVYDRDHRVIRGSTVYAASQSLALAEDPIESPLCGGGVTGKENAVELQGLHLDLAPGRFVIMSGERQDIRDTTGVFASETVMITAVAHDIRAAGDRMHTFLWFDKPIQYCYRRETVTLYGNVVKASQGETRIETLGGGDGAKAWQTFTLKQSPLTHIAAPTPAGAESTLHLFVNDVRWRETPYFADRGATERVYSTRTDENAGTMLVFGDGRHGARLPTGLANVKAVYRSGMGSAGNVRAGQISQLATRPLGVKEVFNPLPASGGADRESRDQARRNAPTAVMALDRLVSIRDYADFSKNFAGISKASAIEISDGRRNLAHVTIAGIDDIPIEQESDLFTSLGRALRDLGNPFLPITLALRESLILVLNARLRIEPDRRWEIVVAEARAKLLDVFSFDRRALGQGVAASEVTAALQSVSGVAYVDMDIFGSIPSALPDPHARKGTRLLTPTETAEAVAELIDRELVENVLAASARFLNGAIRPAQIAFFLPEVPETLVLNQIL